MEKLNCFRGQFDFEPGRFVYQQPPTEGPKEQGEKREEPKKTPDEARREGQKAEVKAKYGDDNLEKVTPEKTKEVLGDPAKLQRFLADFEKSRMEDGMREGMMKPEHIVREMLDAVKTDTAFLKKVIETYADKVDSQYGYVCNNAIERINLVDDKFFIGVFERSKGYHIRSEAIRKIKDQAYLKKVAEEYKKKGDISADNEGAAALENITDQVYLKQVALDENADNFMRERALSRSTDKALLQTFASIPDREAGQHFTENGKGLYETPESWTKPFHKGILRDAARRRLDELK